MRALVTGGAGFIGSNLVLRLLEDGHELRVLDNLSTGQRSNLPASDVELIEADIRSYERVSAATKDVEVVFHLAALPSITRSLDDPLTTNAINVDGTLNVLLAARDNGVSRVVAASSSSVYGNTPGMPRRESGPVAPLAPYPVSKLAAEQYCLAVTRVYGLETVALRYFNAFGERQDPFSAYAAVVPRFVMAMLGGEPPGVFGDGTAARDFTHIENAVDATIAAATAEQAVGLAINVGMGSMHTVNELVETLGRLMGVDVAPHNLPPRVGEAPMSLADISLARDVLGYSPEVDFETGLERTIAWFSEYGDQVGTEAVGQT
jgi:nucleoside-diphosphate-sugar epimerase